MDGFEEGRRLSERRAEVESLARDLTSWAGGEPAIRALALVGSWSRGQAAINSDLDLLLLTDQPDLFTDSDGWLDVLGGPPVVRGQQFGVITERRVCLQSGLEVEFGIGPVSWACTTPVDAGSRRVISDGARILHDPDGLLDALQAAVAPSGPAPKR